LSRRNSFCFTLLTRNLPVSEIQTMGDLVSVASARRRFKVRCSRHSLVLHSSRLVGLYGLMAYPWAPHARVGIRMALGAQR